MRWRLTLTCMLLICGSGTSLRAQARCDAAPPRPIVAGETIVLSETKRFPCRIRIVATPIELRADAAGAVADVSGAFMAPDGRFLTFARSSAEVSVWSASGQFTRNFGTEGRGPGEFARGFKNIKFDRNGNTYIADNNRQWSVFSSSFQFVRATSASETGIAREPTSLLDDGTLLSAVAASQFPFRLFDLAPSSTGPRLVRSFGTDGLRGSRSVAYAHGATFWAGPSPGGDYALELWSTDGKRLRTLRRAVPWFPRAGDESRPRGNIPPPEFEMINDDGAGVLFIRIVIANDKFQRNPPGADAAARTRAMQEMVDIYIEAIDGNAGVVLASSGPLRPAQAQAEFPEAMFPGTRRGYRRSETPEGLPALRIVEVTLVRQ